MDVNTIMVIVAALVGIAIGAFIVFLIIKKSNEGKANSILKEAEAEAEVIKKDKMLQAKEKFLQLKAEHEKFINEKNQAIHQSENRVKQREQSLSQKHEKT
jgi:ribonuclease Y